MKSLAKAYQTLTREDFSVLKGIETGMRNREWVLLEEIARISGLTPSRADFRIREMAPLKLVATTNVPYEGYQIGFDAYDLLALDDLVKRDAVLSLGGLAGVGKESVVYEALGDGPLALKFHREGRTSFRHVRRVREHLKDKPRVSWLRAASLAARAEFKALTKLYSLVEVPRPVSLNRHALAMSLVEGVQLSRARLSQPRDVLSLILDQVDATLSVGLVHADLSEFNVFVGEGGVSIIDWAQAVTLSHPHARELLERDVSNILKFFKRKYSLQVDLHQALPATRPEIFDSLSKEADQEGEEVVS